MVRLHITKREFVSVAKMTIPAAFFIVLYLLFEKTVQSLSTTAQLFLLLVFGALTALLYRKAIRKFLL